MAAVQTAVTVVALVTVAFATAATMSFLLRRRADHLLMDVATRVASVMERLPPETTEPHWIAYEAEEQRPAGMRIEVRSAEGTLLAAVGENFDLPPALSGCADRAPVRVCGTRSTHFAVVAAAQHANDDATRQYLALVLLTVVAAAAILVAIVGRRVALGGLRPLADLAARTGAIIPGRGARLTDRIGLAELDIFAERFDDLLARFEEALERERRLAAEASHELRTPITVARAEIEGLTAAATDDGAVLRALKALDRLSALVEALLWFAKAQTRLDDASMEVVNLADVVRSEVAAYQRTDDMRVIRCDLPDEALVRGDERLLGRVAANLVDNALKYGRKSPIEIRGRQDASRVELSFANAGTVPASVIPRLFEPFYRGNGASTDATGFGLGLPFARAVARAHGGDLVIDDRAADRTAFVLSLPLVAWTEQPPSDATS
jgi:two-component system heavy metal sensor histidine kinase CusS